MLSQPCETFGEVLYRFGTLVLVMRKLLAGVLAFGIVALAADAASAAKKPAPKKGTKTGISAHKTAGTARARTASSKRGKKGPARRVTWRNRQLTPTPERYKEIQQALAAKGYLPSEQATGKWDDTSTAALKKFQADQNLDTSGKIDSLSLIARGLGPKHETAAAAKPAASPANSP